MTNDHITFQLPVGYRDANGTLHRQGELRPLTGKEEEMLSQRYGKESGASLVTVLLSRCVRQLGTLPAFSVEEAGQLPRVDRDYLLLLLWENTFGSRVRATVLCPRPGCEEKNDIDFSILDIPFGEPGEDKPKPLEMEVQCCECGEVFTIPFDVYGSFFSKLCTGLDMLYREVHGLAYHYHWSEREIMAMSRGKRHKYLEILADELERMDEYGELPAVAPTQSFMPGQQLIIKPPPELPEQNNKPVETGDMPTTPGDAVDVVPDVVPGEHKQAGSKPGVNTRFTPTDARKPFVGANLVFAPPLHSTIFLDFETACKVHPYECSRVDRRGELCVRPPGTPGTPGPDEAETVIQKTAEIQLPGRTPGPSKPVQVFERTDELNKKTESPGDAVDVVPDVVPGEQKAAVSKLNKWPDAEIGRIQNPDRAPTTDPRADRRGEPCVRPPDVRPPGTGNTVAASPIGRIRQSRRRKRRFKKNGQAPGKTGGSGAYPGQSENPSNQQAQHEQAKQDTGPDPGPPVQEPGTAEQGYEPGRQERAPHAFWERIGLGHYHLNIVR
jgi:hypothetical protein